jgi:hypothetical protein
MYDHPSNQAGAPMPRTQPRLEQLGDRIEKSLIELQELNGRLCNVADRICGPVPEAVDNNKSPPQPSATVGRLESMSEGLGHLLRRLRQSVDRLETL